MAKTKKIPKKIRDALLVEARHKCTICFERCFEIHHIIKKSEGGTDDDDNLIVLCPNCHQHRYHRCGEFTPDQLRLYKAKLKEANEIEQELREELEYFKAERSQHLCPFCEAPIIQQNEVCLDPEYNDYDIRVTYDCGYEVVAGQLQRPCPSDPSFPKLKEFDLQVKYNPDEPMFKWSCYMKPKTHMAQLLSPGREIGRTEEEARDRIVKRYLSYAKEWSH
jgi:hypothetical protein